MVDQLAEMWALLLRDPALAAWIVFGLLSGLVGVYKRYETQIKERAAQTETGADDVLVKVLDGVVGVFEVLRLFVPHGIARPKGDDDATTG